MTISRKMILVWTRDIAGVAAVASIAIGAGMIFLPAGLIVGGALVLAAVVASARGDK
jgi:amino acid permease